jgi:hypothetical protein
VAYHLGGQRLAAGDNRHEFGEHSFGECDVSGLTGECHRVAAHVQICGQNALEGAQVFVSGTEQAHDEVGRNVDAAANLRCRRTSSVGFAGRHVAFDACFLRSVQRVSVSSLPPRGNPTQ